MGKPVKIRKKNSFMFTTRHYSAMSIAGIVIGVACLSIVSFLIMLAYKNAGKIDTGVGGVGLFSAFLNIIGIVCGLYGLSERDVYIAPSVAAITINGATILGWVVLMILAYLT